MKKVDLLLFGLFIIACIIGSPCQAQTNVGVSGGGGFTQSTGFRMALPLEFQLSRHIYLFGGPAYMQRRNMELVRKLPAGRDYHSAEINYLSLPILLKIRLDWEPIRIYGLAGLEINYGIRMNANGVEDYRLFREQIDFSRVSVNRFDGGLCAGAGIETDLHRNRKIFADLRYYLGVFDIDQSSQGEIFNEGAFVTLGFMLPLGEMER